MRTSRLHNSGYRPTLCLVVLLALAFSSSAAAQDAKPEPVTLQVVDQAGFEKVLKGQRGKVVLVDVWATWCLPCVKGFPHTVQLHQKFARQGLAVVSLSLDDPDESESVREFLQKQQARFPNLLSKYGADAAAIEAFNIAGGGLPHFKLYDRQGKLVETFASGDPNRGQFTHEDIAAAVKKRLDSQ